VAAVDWFATEAAAPPAARTPRAAARPRSRPHARRLTGGIFWISAFAVLLAGVVAVNVAVLRLNMAVDDLNKRQIDLQAQNQALSSRVSSAGSSLRIEQAARRLGLVPAPATDMSYLNLARK
jgi:hypothetical protein